MRHARWLGLTLSMLLSFTAFGVAPPVSNPASPEVTVSPRLTKFRQLSFDRRPSAMLKAWAPTPPVKPEKTKPDPLDLELQAFQRDVTLGKWTAVKSFLLTFEGDEKKAAYQHLLQRLMMNPAMQSGGMNPGMPAQMMEGMPAGGNPQLMQFAERNRVTPDDIVGLASAAPVPLDDALLTSLGSLLRQCLSNASVVEAVVKRFQAEVAKPKDAALTTRQAARLLVQGGEAANAEGFLPTSKKAIADKDIEALNLLSSVYLAQNAREKKLVLLERAWEVLQAALLITPTADTQNQHQDTLRQAVELAPRLKEELGQHWLEESFSRETKRGMTILATIGTLSSQGLQRQAQNADQRLKTLKLLKTAVESLLKASPAQAKQWKETVQLLAGIWLQEGEFSQRFAPSSSETRMRRDRFGNIYFMGDDPFRGNAMPRNPNQPAPIGVVDILQTRPEKAWIDLLSEDERPRLFLTLCQLHLKADEESQAFPYIEGLATTHPRKARELVDEFLRVWKRNHDPNAARAYTNPYMFIYGFDQRASGIPLTRSKQERNLDDLAGWVARLRKLKDITLDEELLADAFTSCHSTAEVYRQEAIEKVFGSMEKLKPETLASLVQKMRENLASVWRRPEVQNEKKTNRKTRDIQAEVTRGYSVALGVVDNTLKKFPGDWRLVLARAALIHDEVGYQAELRRDAKHGPRRLATYAEFERAAKLYAAKVKDLPEEDQTTRVFEQWLYASLGACDLGQITEEKVPDVTQVPRIRAALKALPGEMATKHLEKFANMLFTRLSAVKPQIKFRYLDAGFKIIGDHPQASEAKKVYDYYKDLVKEIKLETRIDGSPNVGHSQPFGVFVNLRHTREIERESGGFGRYLQNQNSSTRYYWNYGRPNTDYRDRFQTNVNEAFREHFEVLSITFETENVNSRAAEEYGWRVTPYAYLLLKAKGPQVDRLPSIRMDLDFLDTSGYVVLPIESSVVPMDAKPKKGEDRPATKFEITQTLDERQAKEGKLILEIKAKAEGLVPELDQVVEVSAEGFKVAKVNDQGVSVARFQQETEKIVVASERTWLITFTAEDGKQPSRTFTFPSAKIDEAKVLYQRYNDADVMAAESVIDLEATYGKTQLGWLWWLGGGAVIAVIGLLTWRALRKPTIQAESRWQIPEQLTPFATIAFLERIRSEGGLNASQQTEITDSIRRVERQYFAETNGEAKVDLKQVAESWLQKAR